MECLKRCKSVVNQFLAVSSVKFLRVKFQEWRFTESRPEIALVFSLFALLFLCSFVKWFQPDLLESSNNYFVIFFILGWIMSFYWNLSLLSSLSLFLVSGAFLCLMFPCRFDRQEVFLAVLSLRRRKAFAEIRLCSQASLTNTLNINWRRS